jgi:hypothetical protein
MTSDSDAVDVLIRELGAVRTASYGAEADASGAIRAAIELAISEATDAVCGCLNAPNDEDGISRAHEAVSVAVDVLAALDNQFQQSLAVRAQGAELRGRARELVKQARAARRA